MRGRLSDDWIASWLCGHRTTEERALALELRDHRYTLGTAYAELDALGVPLVREVTGETITDEQIQRLRARALVAQDRERTATCHDALPGSTYWHSISDWGETRPVPESVRVAARARCAAAYNALPESDRLLTLVERIQWLAARGGGR